MCNCLLRLFSFTKAIKSSIPLVLQKAASSLVPCRCTNLIQKNKTISLYDKYFRIDAAISIYNLTKCFWLKAERRVTARWASCHRAWLWDVATNPCIVFVSVLFNSWAEPYATKTSTTLIEYRPLSIRGRKVISYLVTTDFWKRKFTSLTNKRFCKNRNTKQRNWFSPLYLWWKRRHCTLTVQNCSNECISCASCIYELSRWYNFSCT